MPALFYTECLPSLSPESVSASTWPNGRAYFVQVLVVTPLATLRWLIGACRPRVHLFRVFPHARRTVATGAAVERDFKGQAGRGQIVVHGVTTQLQILIIPRATPTL